MVAQEWAVRPLLLFWCTQQIAFPRRFDFPARPTRQCGELYIDGADGRYVATLKYGAVAVFGEYMSAPSFVPAEAVFCKARCGAIEKKQGKTCLTKKSYMLT